MALSLPRLFTGWEKLSDTFVRYWNEAMSNIETNINDIIVAQETADTGIVNAASAQGTADDALSDAATANANANTRVLKSAGPSFSAPTGALSRTPYASYVSAVVSNPPTQAEVQAISDGLQALSQHVVAVITDLRSNQALTP